MIFQDPSTYGLSNFDNDLPIASSAGDGITLSAGEVSVNLQIDGGGLEFNDGGGDTEDLRVNAGDGITITDGSTAIDLMTGGGLYFGGGGVDKLAVSWAGTGSASTSARSDHTHSYDNYQDWTFQTSGDSNSDDVASGETIILSGTNGITVTHPTPGASPYSIVIDGSNVTGTEYDAGDGIGITGSEFYVDLASVSGLQLSGTNPNKKLAILPNPEGGRANISLVLNYDGVGLSINPQYIDLGDGSLSTSGDDDLTFATTGTTTINLPSGTNTMLVNPITEDLDLDDYEILINQAITVSGVASGLKVNAAVHSEVNSNQLVYWDTTSSSYRISDPSTSSTMPAIGLSLVNGSGAAGDVLLFGLRYVSTASMTPGAVYYIGDTPGTLDDDPPTGTGDIVQAVGVALTSTLFYFNPSFSLVVRD